MGYVDSDGYLYLTGRMGEMIIRGGENIYPQEIEQILTEHPTVRECAVIGVPDAKWGQIVKAFVVPTDPGAPPDTEQLRAWTRSQLAGFKVPAQWTFVPALPRNAAGKVVRRDLR
jgi:acyl-CoA synthetase (AMP-forming)/AMP-acid ligase II